jgi:ABC-type sugar transport system ATPase subunit
VTYDGASKEDVTPHAAASPHALDVRGVVKVYGGTVALRGVSFSVARGEIHGLVGENGAGKSTLVRIITGVERQDSGDVTLGGGNGGAGDCAVIHQNLALIEEMSVAENIALATGFRRRRWSTINWRATRRTAREALDRLGVTIDPRAEVAELPLAQRAIVAIARALAQNTKLVIFDEPTANLQAAEVRMLFSIIERLRESDVACLLISHRMDEVLSSCDRITVLRDGTAVGTWPAAELSPGRLIELILGRKATVLASHTAASAADVLVRAEGACVEAVGPVDFEVRRGEIFAITGLADAGHITLAEALFGVKPITSGALFLDGQPYRPASPRSAVAAGVAYVPPDRHRDGIAAELTARENLFMRPRQRALQPLRLRSERRAARQVLTSFDVRPPQPEREMSTFSGGNQQKVVLGKWLSRPRKLVVLSEPTTGVDVGAKLEIYELLRRTCDAPGGAGVVIASSDFEEVALLADRVLVLYRGRPVRIIERPELTFESVTQAAYDIESLESLV